MYVIERIDGGGGYVTPAGSERSYTRVLEKARMFATRESAQTEKCGNEVVVNVWDLLP